MISDGGAGQGRQRILKTVCGTAHDAAFFIEKVTDRLNLGQNETALGRLNVLRHDKKDDIFGRGQISGDTFRLGISGHSADEGLTELMDALAGACAYRDAHVRLRYFFKDRLAKRTFGPAKKIALIKYNKDRNVPAFDLI